MYKTKYYFNDFHEPPMVVLFRSRTANQAYENHKKALRPALSNESQNIVDEALREDKKAWLYIHENPDGLSEEQRHILNNKRVEILDKAYKQAFSLTLYYPEDYDQIITTNSNGIIVGYGSNMDKLRKAAKVKVDYVWY